MERPLVDDIGASGHGGARALGLFLKGALGRDIDDLEPLRLESRSVGSLVLEAFQLQELRVFIVLWKLDRRIELPAVQEGRVPAPEERHQVCGGEDELSIATLHEISGTRARPLRMGRRAGGSCRLRGDDESAEEEHEHPGHDQGDPSRPVSCQDQIGHQQNQ